MANKQKSSNVTIANVVSIVGVVLLLLFTFMGHSYMSGGELGWDILISVGIAGVTALLLWFMIKAKGAENNLTKWKRVEFITLFVYIAFALTTSIFGGVMHFFVVNDQKEDIKKYAHSDLQKIDKMFGEYKSFEEQAISKTNTGLLNSVATSQVRDEGLMKFFNQNNISCDKAGVDAFITLQKDKLLHISYEKHCANFKKQRDEILNVVNSWSILMIPSKAKLIKDLAESAEKELTKLSNAAKLPVIEDGGGIWTISEENQVKDFKVEDGVENLEFVKSMKEAKGFSVLAVLIVMLIHLLILFSYIVAYRTSTMANIDMEEDGGRIL